MGGVGERLRRDPRRRLTVAQAADQLGISVDAMRARVKRATVDTEREGGRVYVLLDAAQDTAQDTAQDAPHTDRTAELIATLQKQLEAEREANRENRRIIAALTSRIPELEAPSEARESPERVEDEAEGTEPRPEAPDAQEGARRPWWRRMFGGGG